MTRPPNRFAAGVYKISPPENRIEQGRFAYVRAPWTHGVNYKVVIPSSRQTCDNDLVFVSGRISLNGHSGMYLW
jgi:enamine deaminase RidA (YjgF/YER057c/UK114 family)